MKINVLLRCLKGIYSNSGENEICMEIDIAAAIYLCSFKAKTFKYIKSEVGNSKHQNI